MSSKIEPKELLTLALIKKLRVYVDDKMAELRAFFTERLDNIQLQRGDKGEPGDTPVKGRDYFDGADGKDYVLTSKDKKEIAKSIVVPVVEKVIEKTEVVKELPMVTNIVEKVDETAIVAKIENDLPTLGEKTRDGLELLSGDDRLDKSAIKGIEDLEKQIIEAKSVKVTGNSRGVQLFIDGTKQGLVQTVNFIAGTGVTLTYNREFGRNDITISNDSVAGTVLDATGTVNSSNRDFTFTAEPSLIVIDGTPYRKTNKIGETVWTWSSPTATLTLAPQSDVYGLR